MAISIERPLRHMAWANQRVYESFASLPEEALDAFITNPEWSARKILSHSLAGADWFVYCLGIAPWTPIGTPKTISDLTGFARDLASCDAKILAAASLDDELLTFTEGEREVKVQRSTLISAAILHSSEHRAQLMDAIESKGFTAMNLEDIDLWNFEYFERKTL
jgi:uncharacterized damage-inducible protein DinB